MLKKIALKYIREFNLGSSFLFGWFEQKETEYKTLCMLSKDQGQNSACGTRALFIPTQKYILVKMELNKVAICGS